MQNIHINIADILQYIRKNIKKILLKNYNYYVEISIITSSTYY
jgi:hypothetical protein